MKCSDRAMMRLMCRLLSNEPSILETLCDMLGLAEVCLSVCLLSEMVWVCQMPHSNTVMMGTIVSEHEAPDDAGRGTSGMTWSKSVERNINTFSLFGVWTH